MGRRFLKAAAGLLVCAALAGLAASARGSSSPALKWRPLGVAPSTINPAAIPVPKGAKKLSVRIGNFTSTSIDNPPTGTSQGDASIGAGQLTRKGAPAGELEVQEVLTSVAPGRATLAATALLARGQITVSAVLHLTNSPLIRAAILGGTGAYAKIRGVMYVTENASGATLTFVYTTS